MVGRQAGLGSGTSSIGCGSGRSRVAPFAPKLPVTVCARLTPKLPFSSVLWDDGIADLAATPKLESCVWKGRDPRRDLCHLVAPCAGSHFIVRPVWGFAVNAPPAPLTTVPC